MDSDRFDTLTRRLSSRRAALVGLLGGVVAVLGLSGAKETSAHNPAPGCKKIKDASKRRACLRRARIHQRNKHSCKPKPRSVTCKNRCGRVRNNCKKPVNCPCPAGKRCLVNGGCNRACAAVGAPGGCPLGCGCGVPLAENPAVFLCVGATILTCEQAPLACITSANCPRGFFCAAATGVCGTDRCVPNCPV